MDKFDKFSEEMTDGRLTASSYGKVYRIREVMKKKVRTFTFLILANPHSSLSGLAKYTPNRNFCHGILDLPSLSTARIMFNFESFSLSIAGCLVAPAMLI